MLVAVASRPQRHTVDGSELRRAPPEMYQNPVSGINYQPQLVSLPDFGTIKSIIKGDFSGDRSEQRSVKA